MGYYDLLGELADQVNRQNALNVLDTKYGAKGDGVTDDTAAVQAAINAANAQYLARGGIVDVVLPTGYGFKLAPLTPKNGVRINAYGATILPDTPNIPNALFWGGFGAQIVKFGIAGGTWIGTGTETSQDIFASGTAASPNGPTNSDVVFRDMRIENWAGGGIYIFNPVRARVLDNVFIDCGVNSTKNTINIVQNTETNNPVHDVLIRGNILDATRLGLNGAAIAYGADNQPGLAATDLRLIVVENTCLGISSGSNNLAGSIDIEINGSTTGGPVTRVMVARNIVEVSKTAGQPMYGITVEALQQKVKVLDNSVKSSYCGILLQSTPDAEVRGNDIDAPTPITGTPSLQSNNRFSTGLSQGRATLVAGTVTVNTAEAQAGDNIILSRVVAGGTLGELSVGAIVAGTSFAINSSSATDTSTVYWKIDH